MSVKTPNYPGVLRAPGVVEAVLGIEDGNGEGIGVVQIQEATLVTGAATYDSGLRTVQGAWAVLESPPGAFTPSIPQVTYSGATVYVTYYDVNGNTSFTATATFSVYCKGIF